MNALITTGKSLINALAFANVSNIDEFRSMLNQVDAPARSSDDLAQRSVAPEAFNHSVFAPAIGHIQGAL
ncbi:MAG: hypothetical protein ACYCZA_08310 [Thiobacillus sp.]